MIFMEGLEMLMLLQMALYCLLFIGLVKCAVKDNGLNVLYFYPKEYIEEAHKRGIADKDATMKKGKTLYDTIPHYYLCCADFDHCLLEPCYRF